MKTRKRHRLTHLLALALALAALAAPAAHAYIPADGGGAELNTPARIDVKQGGFDWTDAGIGAGFAVGLLLLAGGVAIATLRRRKTTIPAV